MAKTILMEEYHLTVFAPRGLPDTAYDAIRHTLDEPRFRAALRRAMREVIDRHPALGPIRVRLTR